jgi:hypothetical protein
MSEPRVKVIVLSKRPLSLITGINNEIQVTRWVEEEMVKADADSDSDSAFELWLHVDRGRLIGWLIKRFLAMVWRSVASDVRVTSSSTPPPLIHVTI